MGDSYPNFMIVFIYRFFLLSYILRSVSQGFYKDGYDKMDELSFFKCSLTSCINKHRDTVFELSSKDTFFKTWNSLLNSNGLIS